jgi:hypothetical protein
MTPPEGERIMNRTNQMILLVPCLLSLNACNVMESRNDIEGRLSVSRSFKVQSKNGSSMNLEAKNGYSATFHMTDKGSDLQIRVQDQIFTDLHPNPDSYDVLLPNPVADKLGKFQVAASASKQSFDTEGEISDVSASTPESGSESCLYDQVLKTVCRDVVIPLPVQSVPSDTRSDPRAPAQPHPGPTRMETRRECHDELVNIYGTQTFRGVRDTKDRIAEIKLIDPADQSTLATFSGTYQMVNVLRDKIYTSACHL